MRYIKQINISLYVTFKIRELDEPIFYNSFLPEFPVNIIHPKTPATIAKNRAGINIPIFIPIFSLA